MLENKMTRRLLVFLGEGIKYRTPYCFSVDYKMQLDQNVSNFMYEYWKGQNVSMHLSLSTLFSLTSSCGPQSRIEGQEQSFSTSLNTYFIAICDPDCEKTETFKKVIEPVTQAIYQQTRKKIQIKKNKHDGIQTH